MMNKLEAAIVVDSLTVMRGNRLVLPKVSLTIPVGNVTGLLGPSGGGKSTLIRAIVGVQKIKSGTITVLGEPAGSVQLRSRVAYCTQTPSVYSDLTVRDNVAYFGSLAKASKPAIDQALAEVDLTDHGRNLVGKLSGGQRCRVSLACALVSNPEVLILDEPTVGLDPVLRRDLWQLFHRLAKAGKTLLVSSHVMDEASRCDTLILLREGRIIANESPQNLLERTQASNAEAAFLTIIDQAEIRAS